MSRSPNSLVPLGRGQLRNKKRNDKALVRKQGEANARAATQVNVHSASSIPPTQQPQQLELFPGRACPLEAKPATSLVEATAGQICRDGVQDGSTHGKGIKTTGETLGSPAAQVSQPASTGKEAYKTTSRKRRPEAAQGVGGGHSTGEARENRVEGRAATSIVRSIEGKAAGLPPQGKAPPQRMSNARKLQRTLYRTAKQQPERRFTLLYDKVYREDILLEAWERVKANGGAGGVDGVTIKGLMKEQGIEQLLAEIRTELETETYRVQDVRRVHIPKPGQPGKTRPLGIPTVKDRIIQMAAKLVLEPLFEADFRPCSYGFRPKRNPRLALSEIAQRIQAGYTHVVDVDLKSYFDTIDHDLLMELVERRVGDVRVLRLIRTWLKAGIMEEGITTHPVRGTPQGGVISPLLSNIMLHEVDRQWCSQTGLATQGVVLVRYADDMVLLARTAGAAQQAWAQLQAQFAALRLEVNQDKSRLATVAEGFAFLGFEFRTRQRRLYMWPRQKACQHIRQRIRELVHATPPTANLTELIRKLNLVLNGWCTYFRVGNSNRVFHKIDRAARDQVQIWLRRKHACDWSTARKRWNYRMLHETFRLYRMVGKVSYLEGLRRTPTAEDGRRAGCGKSASPVR